MPWTARVVQRPAGEVRRAFEEHRARVGAGDRDAQVGEPVAVARHRRGATGHRVFDRAADAHLVVARAEVAGCSGADVQHEFAGLHRHIVDAVTGRTVLPRMADEEVAHGDRARAVRAEQVDFPVEQQHRRREIAGIGREADAFRLGRDMAHLAQFGLEAVVVGFAPPFGLVVVDAAGIQADVAADRAHVALGRPGDRAGGLGDRRIAAPDFRMLGDLVQPRRRPDDEPAFVDFYGLEIGQVVGVDQDRRRLDLPPDVDQQVGAAADHPAFGMGEPRGQRLLNRPRTDDLEIVQRVHQAALFRALKRAAFSRARNTLSGVIGVSAKRMPVAS